MGKIIDGEFSCNNCVEKTRCKQQQETKKQRIDAILSYITNEDNKKYIEELKNEIPAITRCDVILEKQLKRLEQENQGLGKILDCKNGTIASLAKVRDELKEENKKLKEKLEKIKEFLVNTCAICGQNNTSKCKDCGCTKIIDIIEGAEDEGYFN